jgi:hypothetical protein
MIAQFFKEIHMDDAYYFVSSENLKHFLRFQHDNNEEAMKAFCKTVDLLDIQSVIALD